MYYNTHSLGCWGPMGQAFIFHPVSQGGSILAIGLAFRFKAVAKVGSAAVAQSAQVSGLCIQPSAPDQGTGESTAPPSRLTRCGSSSVRLSQAFV